MSDDKKEAAAPAAAAPSADGGEGGSKITVILTAVNLLVTLGVVGFLAFQFIQEKKQAALEDIDPEADTHAAAGDGKAAEGHGEAGAGGLLHGSSDSAAYGKMVALDPFTVNLATSGSVQPRFARVNISVEIASDEVEAEVTAKMPQVRNIVLDLFNSKRPSDLQNPEGRNYLKEELRNAINSALVSGKVKGVFFTSFAMSS